jgi:hypothetical protein
MSDFNTSSPINCIDSCLVLLQSSSPASWHLVFARLPVSRSRAEVWFLGPNVPFDSPSAA